MPPKRKSARADDIEPPSKRKSARANDIAEKKRSDALRDGLEWQNHGEASNAPYIPPLLYLTSSDLPVRSKVAAFDIDSTLIETKSGRKFASGATDWKWLYECVPERLRELDEAGYRVCFVTNQAGIEKLKLQPEEITTKINALIQELDIPCFAFVSTGNTNYRKPSTVIWDFLQSQNDGVTVDKAQSFYVGDAAGRAKNWAPGKPKDFSCTDRMFAANVGIDFKTPEEFFLHEEPAPFEWRSFDAKKYLETAKLLPTKPTETYHSDKQELVLMYGPPACGKSSFAKTYFTPHGYDWINRDTLSTPAKCLKAAEAALKAGRSAVIDNTNPSIKDRKPYIELAKKYEVPSHCVVIDTPLEIAHHLNYVRQNLTNGDVRRIPDVAYNVFKKNAQAPKLDEGFKQITHVPFELRFENDTHKRLFSQWT